MLLQIENPEYRQSAIRRPWKPHLLANSSRSIRQWIAKLQVSKIPQSLFNEVQFLFVRTSCIIPQQVPQNIFQQLLKAAKLAAESLLSLNTQFNRKIYGARLAHGAIPFEFRVGHPPETTSRPRQGDHLARGRRWQSLPQKLHRFPAN